MKTTNTTRLEYRPLTNPLMSRDMGEYLIDFMAMWQAGATPETCIRVFQEYADRLNAAARAENARGWTCKAADWSALAKMVTDRIREIEVALQAVAA